MQTLALWALSTPLRPNPNGLPFHLFPLPSKPLTLSTPACALSAAPSAAPFSSPPPDAGKAKLAKSSSSVRLPPRAVAAEVSEEPLSCPPVGFVEVGYVCNVHGLKGELRVKSTSDFPHLRFCTPGTRWLRSLVLGKERIQQVELLGGRQGHKGGWIVNLHGIDSVDQARQFVGSAILVREDDRPELENGEFYSLDLVGMKVVLKENGTKVGTVVNVVNYGSSDLLQVMLDKSDGVSSKPSDGAHGSLVWIPFVEAIVPDVDMKKREMQITPPKGLLELNLRSDLRSKKERSKMEWKEKKKFQHRVSAAKKKLTVMGQNHVLQGFSCRGKEKRAMLANQIVDIDYNLFQYALDHIRCQERFNLSEFLETDSVRSKSTSSPADKESGHFKLQASGIKLLRENRVCTVLVIVGRDNQVSQFQTGVASSGKSTQTCELLSDWLLKMHEQQISAPLVIISPHNDVEYYQQLFLENDYYGFDVEKVRFLKEASLPVLAYQNPRRMLMKSPWEILQSPVGSGGIFSLLSMHHIIDEICGWGVDYVQVCGLAEASTLTSPMLLGLVNSKRSDIGFGISCNGTLDPEDNSDVVLTLRYLKEIINDPSKIQITAVAAECEHVELVNGEWVNVCKTESNCLFLRSSIYSILSTCSPDSFCILRTSTD